jgi:hypothetical protein
MLIMLSASLLYIVLLHASERKTFQVPYVFDDVYLVGDV